MMAAAIVSISMLGCCAGSAAGTPQLVVTDRRVLLTSGTLSRRVAPSRWTICYDLQIHVSGIGRLLRYGCVIANTSGRRAPLLGIRRIPIPTSSSRCCWASMQPARAAAAAQRSAAPAAIPPPAVDLARAARICPPG